jgi:signal transduction histidine kinase
VIDEVGLPSRRRAVGGARGRLWVGFSAPRLRALHMARGAAGVYRDHVTSADMPDAPRRGRAVPAVLSALWSADSRRAARHVLAGIPAAFVTAMVLGGLFVIWGAAVLSLVEGPTGAPELAVLYAVVAVAGPLPLPWCVWALSVMQRRRFGGSLGVEIPEPPRSAVATWRQSRYHALALLIGAAGTVLVPVLLLAPRAGRALARADEAAARRLLGPSRTEVLTERVESLARSRADIVAATDAERRRIERDLHDGAQQRLISLAMNLGMARENLAGVPESAREAIEQAHEEATQAVTELREFVRGLHPAILDDRGLDAALSGIVARAPLPVGLHVDIARRCSPSIEAIAYFVVSEALTNIAKHADARHADVTLERVGDRLRVVVTDDGSGGATLDTGSGLRGLAQRTAAVDGTLRVHSPAGGPTTITVELPCE